MSTCIYTQNLLPLYSSYSISLGSICRYTEGAVQQSPYTFGQFHFFAALDKDVPQQHLWPLNRLSYLWSQKLTSPEWTYREWKDYSFHEIRRESPSLIVHSQFPSIRSRLTFLLWQRGRILTYLFLFTQCLYGSSKAPNGLHMLSQVILINTCEFITIIISHLTDEDTEAQRG